MGVCRSPSLLCGVVFLLALAGSTLGQGEHSISDVNLTSTAQLELGSSGNIFTCEVTVVCQNTPCLSNSTLTVTWFRDTTNVTSATGYMVVGMNMVSTNATTTLTSTLTITASAAAAHLGQYYCSAVLNNNDTTKMDSMPMNLALKIPAPMAELTGDASVAVGSTASLTCNVILQQYSSYSSIQNTLTVTVDLLHMGSMAVIDTSTISPPSSMMSQTRMFTLSNVNASNAGQYQCRANVSSTDSNVVTSAPDNSSAATLNIQLPQPTVTFGNASVAVGSTVSLTCNVTLQQYSSYSSIPITVTVELLYGNTVMTNSTPSVSGAVHTSVFTLSNVGVSNAGQYQCRATVTTTASNVVAPTPRDSPNATLYVVGSTVTASPTTVLDVSPYNNFTLTCTVTVTPSVTPTISYQWSGNHVTTMDSSTITVLSTTTGTSPYQCNATVTVSNLNSVTTMSNIIMVTVKGTVLPNVPSSVMSNPLPDSANITFTITSVTYTPETYSIQYGISASNLDLTSDNVTSRGVDTVHSFIGLTNEVYSITLTGLTINTNYSFRVVAMNTNGSSSTDVFNFTTAEAPPGPPNNPRITEITSRSFTFSWAVPMQPNGVITGYNYSCTETGTINVIRSGNTAPTITSVDITAGLSPFTNYACSVSASTAQGVGPSVSITGITGEEAPGSPPVNFMIITTTSTTLTLQWNPPTMRNGIIRMYRYFCTQVGMRGEGGNGDFSGGAGMNMMTPSMNATVLRLYPFTNYNCSVLAITVGEGPGATAIGTTSDGVPEMVQNLVVSGESANMFRVNWTSPMIDNGAITTYSIVVTDYTSDTVVSRTNVTAVTDDDTNQYSQTVTSLQLEQGVPYNVSVAAYTSAGMGSAVSLTEFTVEGAPAAVRNVNVMRINNTALSVSWTPLTITEARGRLTGYVITLTPVSLSRKRQASVVMRTVLPSESSVTIGGLDPTQQYSVTVAGSTSAGNGNMSIDVTPSPPVPSPSVTPVQPVPNNTVLIAVIVVIGIVVVFILVLALVILIVCFMKSRRSTTKLHTLTVKENEVALNIVEGDNGSNGKGIELKAMETKTALDDDAIRRCEPVPMDEFPQHCGKLHFNRDLGFEEEYETFKNVPKGSFMVSKLPNNTQKNRFENVYSFDNARVILPAIEGVPGSDYINASYMNGYNKENAYIAAQGPLPQTVGDFWRMVWELKLPTVVMLTELIERGIEKCHCYWPKSINHTLDVGFGLKITLVEQKAFVEYKYKEIAITSNDPSSKPLKVAHYHFTAWPDHGVPADKTCMLAFIKRVRKTHPPDGPPLLVHCSAGVGRTGTFIVLDSNLQRMKAEGTLNIYELITDMRTKRVLMVQTEAQYVYLHDALQEYITCGDTSIPAEKIRAVTLTLQKVSEHKSGYQKQFELLEEVSIKPSDSYCTDALAKENMEKNRFPQQLETLPYNNTRIRFRTMTGIGGGAGGEGGGSNYINASYVDGYKHRGAFLATQTPLKDTIEDFWHMLWETQSKAIVMLCNLEEEGKDPYPQYWPAKSGETATYGKMKVKLMSEKPDTEFVTRKLEVSLDTDYINLAGGGEDQFVVTQYHYTKWPEQGKPSTPAGMLKMMEPLLKTQQAAGNKSITVVCSDGIGRTGAFACIYSQLERVKTEAMADFFQYIKGSRFQRSGLVQTLDHYIYCHEVVCEFLSSFDNYHNFQGADK